jgi:2-dehydropantoate 2-reductase
MADRRLKREYVVVGIGAIGGTLAFHLARAGHRVVGVDTDIAHVASIRRRGIIIRRAGREDAGFFDAFGPDDAPGRITSAVLLCVKGVGATERAVAWIAPRLVDPAFVVCIQNGLHYQHVVGQLGAGRTVGAFVDFFADVVEPGVIEDGGAGTLNVGEIDGHPSARVDQVVSDLQVWGPARATGNVVGCLWSKLGFSAMLAATALADAPMAELIDRHREIMIALAGEVFAVAARRGISLEPFDSFDPGALQGTAEQCSAAVDRLVAWLHRQSKTRSGVWRDIAVHGRATEAAVRYAQLVADARASAITCPCLESLVELLGECESGRRPMADANLRLLRERSATRSITSDR